MRFWLTITLLVAFTGIAVFGFAGMAGGEHERGGCLAATARGTDCPNESNTFTSAVFHLGALKSFSTGLAGLAATILIVLGASVLLSVNHNLPIPSVFRYLEPATNSPTPTRLTLISWLSLHENSPATL